jgi:hypothetical protein
MKFPTDQYVAEPPIKKGDGKILKRKHTVCDFLRKFCMLNSVLRTNSSYISENLKLLSKKENVSPINEGNSALFV